MATEDRYRSFDEFWPYYVAMHSRAATRWLHLVGTLTGAVVAVTGPLRGRPARLAAFPALGYGFAWPSHVLVERNNPASFGHPLWSLRGDAKMIATMLAGRDAELAAIAADWLAAHAEGTAAPNVPAGRVPAARTGPPVAA